MRNCKTLCVNLSITCTRARQHNNSIHEAFVHQPPKPLNAWHNKADMFIYVHIARASSKKDNVYICMKNIYQKTINIFACAGKMHNTTKTLYCIYTYTCECVYMCVCVCVFVGCACALLYIYYHYITLLIHWHDIHLFYLDIFEMMQK